jgi:hypothetical protein
MNAPEPAKHLQDNRMAHNGFRGNPFCRDIIQPTTGTKATIAWKRLILLQIVGTPVA